MEFYSKSKITLNFFGPSSCSVLDHGFSYCNRIKWELEMCSIPSQIISFFSFHKTYVHFNVRVYYFCCPGCCTDAIEHFHSNFLLFFHKDSHSSMHRNGITTFDHSFSFFFFFPTLYEFLFEIYDLRCISVRPNSVLSGT